MKNRFWGAMGVVTLIIIFTVTSFASPVTEEHRIVLAGDSLTNGYGAYMQTDLDQIQPGCTVIKQAYSGIWTGAFTGQEPYKTDATGNPIYVQGVANIIDQDPDVVVLMLGTNDAAATASSLSYFSPKFTQNMTTILDQLQAYHNSRGMSPIILLSSLIPILPPSLCAGANVNIDNSFNPWISQEAQQRGLLFMDTHDALMSQPNWEAYYNDGVHLYANNAAGFKWMSSYVSRKVAAAVPEPALLSVLVLGCAGLLARQRT